MKYLTGIQLNKLIAMLEQDPLEYPITTGVLDGTFNGFALADDQDNPSKALVFHNLVGFLHYIGAQPTQSEARELASKALSYKSERNYYNVVEFAHCPPSVIDFIEKQEQKIRKYNRISWEHDSNLFLKAPDPVNNQEILVSFLKSEDFKNSFVKEECEMFWETYEIFLDKAFGTIARNKQGHFLGVCGAVSDSNGFYEINIETVKAHRKKGVGYAIAHKYIKECYLRGYLPHWDCYEYNEGSQALAKKLGFREAGRYPLISWEY